MASELGLSTGLIGLPTPPQPAPGGDRHIGDFQRSLSAVQMATPSTTTPGTSLGSTARSAVDAVRQLEQEAAVLWRPPSSTPLHDSGRTAKLGTGQADANFDYDRTYANLINVAQKNLKLTVVSQVMGNVVSKPGEVAQKLLQG